MGVAFQPRKEATLNPESINRGWKAAPTEITPILKLICFEFVLWVLDIVCNLRFVICFFRFIQLGSDKINLGAFDTVDRQHQLWRNYAESDR